MEMLILVLEKAEQAGVYRYEGMHEILLRLTGQTPTANSLDEGNVPIDIQSYRVQKADLHRFSILTSGGDLQ